MEHVKIQAELQARDKKEVLKHHFDLQHTHGHTEGKCHTMRELAVCGRTNDSTSHPTWRVNIVCMYVASIPSKYQGFWKGWSAFQVGTGLMSD